MRTAELFDALAGVSPEVLGAWLRELGPIDINERDPLRDEAVRRLVSGELEPEAAVAILPLLNAEPAVPDLVRLLRSEAPPAARAAAFLLLRQHTTYDLERELAAFDQPTLAELIPRVMAMSKSVGLALQVGTPFERLARADPEDIEVDIDVLVDELLEAFHGSPEASAAEDADDLEFWAGALVRYGVVYGHGSPVLWMPDDVDEILEDLLPQKVTIESAAEAESAVPAFRTFFRWAARVATMPQWEDVDALLADLEGDFPAMMMDERRFGMAKSFVLQGTAAGFDMSTDEGLKAFQAEYNRQRQHQRQTAAAAPRKKADAAKKRKAKMAKLSRRKNRRRK